MKRFVMMFVVVATALTGACVTTKSNQEKTAVKDFTSSLIWKSVDGHEVAKLEQGKLYLGVLTFEKRASPLSTKPIAVEVSRVSVNCKEKEAFETLLSNPEKGIGDKIVFTFDYRPEFGDNLYRTVKVPCIVNEKAEVLTYDVDIERVASR